MFTDPFYLSDIPILVCTIIYIVFVVYIYILPYGIYIAQLLWERESRERERERNGGGKKLYLQKIIIIIFLILF